jgi:hypothetical protein
LDKFIHTFFKNGKSLTLLLLLLLVVVVVVVVAAVMVPVVFSGIFFGEPRVPTGLVGDLLSVSQNALADCLDAMRSFLFVTPDTGLFLRQSFQWFWDCVPSTHIHGTL